MPDPPKKRRAETIEAEVPAISPYELFLLRILGRCESSQEGIRALNKLFSPTLSLAIQSPIMIDWTTHAHAVRLTCRIFRRAKSLRS